MRIWLSLVMMLSISGCDEVTDFMTNNGPKKVRKPIVRQTPAPQQPVYTPAPQKVEVPELRGSTSETVKAEPAVYEPAPYEVSQVNLYGGVAIVNQAKQSALEYQLRPDDWILKVNGNKVTCGEEIMTIAARAFEVRPKPLSVLIMRDGQLIALDVGLDDIAEVSFLDPDSCQPWDK